MFMWLLATQQRSMAASGKFKYPTVHGNKIIIPLVSKDLILIAIT